MLSIFLKALLIFGTIGVSFLIFWLNDKLAEIIYNKIEKLKGKDRFKL